MKAKRMGWGPRLRREPVIRLDPFDSCTTSRPSSSGPEDDNRCPTNTIEPAGWGKLPVVVWWRGRSCGAACADGAGTACHHSSAEDEATGWVEAKVLPAIRSVSAHEWLSI